MRHSFSLAALALSLLTLAAPVCFAGTIKPQTQAVTVPDPAACPVGLSATQREAANLIATNKTYVSPDGKKQFTIHTGPRLGPPQQSFDLSMTNSRLQRIVAAELEVHGTSNQSRILPASAAVLTDHPSANTVRNVHLTGSVPADETRTRAVSVSNLTSVAWIDVIELRYADGSTWHAHPGSACRVTPDPMMLVAGR